MGEIDLSRPARGRLFPLLRDVTPRRVARGDRTDGQSSPTGCTSQPHLRGLPATGIVISSTFSLSPGGWKGGELVPSEPPGVLGHSQVEIPWWSTLLMPGERQLFPRWHEAHSCLLLHAHPPPEQVSLPQGGGKDGAPTCLQGKSV